MGLFSKLKTESTTPDYLPKNEQEAWVAIMYCICHADGNFSDAESDSMSRSLVFKSLFTNYNTVELLRKAIFAEREIGEVKLITEAAKLITSETRDTLFAVSVDLVMSDGKIEPEEQNIIEKVSKALGVDPILAENIVNVLLIKNKFARLIIDDDEDD